jgi:hypothetical protein
VATATASPGSANINGRPDVPSIDAVGGPVRSAWREGTLTRATELESLFAWLFPLGPEASPQLSRAVGEHLRAAREAARQRRHWAWLQRSGPSIERAISNLDAVEAHLLQVAPADYLLGQMPCLLNQARRHLPPEDPRRQEIERIARRAAGPDSHQERIDIVNAERRRIVSVIRGAASAALREQLRVRSFRNVLAVTAATMAVLALGLVIVGLLSPATLPLCFQPEQAGQTVVVCPTAQSDTVADRQPPGPASADIDEAVRDTASPQDLLIVELIGLAAASLAAATAVRKLRGSSEPHGLPVTLAVLKLPTGAITAVLGLLLMRGQFVPGLSALDTSAQVLAWALAFGYAQQLFTRLVDHQANAVLNDVRGAEKARPADSGEPATVG